MLYPIFQYAFFVNDVEEAAHKWHRLYGAGPFVLVPHHKTDKFQFRGTKQEADVSYGFGYLADNQIQFIQQHDDTPSIYRDMYGPGEEGFHHVGCMVNDFAAARARMTELGFENAEAISSELPFAWTSVMRDKSAGRSPTTKAR